MSMQADATETPLGNGAARRWPLFLMGVVLFFVGPVINAVEVLSGRLTMPWYLPILMTLGVLFMIASVRQRGGILRISGMVIFALLCGGIWYFTLVVSRVPEYAGPAQPGKKIPAFTTKLADGKSFTDRDLETGDRSVLLFFRGRW
jgi:hypothetical protein